MGRQDTVDPSRGRDTRPDGSWRVRYTPVTVEVDDTEDGTVSILENRTEDAYLGGIRASEGESDHAGACETCQGGLVSTASDDLQAAAVGRTDNCGPERRVSTGHYDHVCSSSGFSRRSGHGDSGSQAVG